MWQLLFGQSHELRNGSGCSIVRYASVRCTRLLAVGMTHHYCVLKKHSMPFVTEKIVFGLARRQGLHVVKRHLPQVLGEKSPPVQVVFLTKKPCRTNSPQLRAA